MIHIPKSFMGNPIEGSLQRILKGSSVTEEKNSDRNLEESPSPTIKNPENYILLPAKKYDDFTYEDCFISMYRLTADSQTLAAAQQRGLSIANTAQEKNGREYIGNINWFGALSLVDTLEGFVLDLRQFADFLALLQSGNAVDGNNRTIKRNILATILEEISKVRSPYRGEWLDADFKVKNNELYINSGHTLKNGHLEPLYSEKLEPCLMENDNVALSSFNKQGLPTQSGSDFYYWKPVPDNTSVARFGVNSVRAGLDCNGHPQNSDGSLGVRLCLSKARANFVGVK